MKRSIIFGIIVMVYAGCLSSRNVMSQDQTDIYAEVVNYYQELAEKEQQITFYKDAEVQQIMLIRHGEPNLDKRSARSRKKMKQYIYDYDTATVYAFDKSPVLFDKTEVDTIYSSAIVRASDTAHKLFEDQFIIVEDSVFREFERGVFPLPFFRLRPKAWGILSRIPWIIGFHPRKIEGFRKARKRTKQGVKFLELKADENGRAVLVAHGFLNRYLSKYLQKDGWQLSYDGGKDYLSVEVLSRVK